MKRNISVLFALTILVFFTSCTNSNTKDESTTHSEQIIIETTEPDVQTFAQKNLIYIALGDSIAAHSGVSAEDGYVELFVEMLGDSGEFESVSVENLAVGGYTTSDMITQLGKQKVIESLESADLVTISIGGNNFLQPVFSAIKGAESMEAVMDRLSGDQFESAANEGIAAFEDEFPKIIDSIKNITPSAEIYVATIFNPCKNSDILYNTVEDLLNPINNIIMGNAVEKNYKVADVYSEFKSLDGENLTFVDFTNMIIDPHPNKEGHILIAETHFNEFIK